MNYNKKISDTAIRIGEVRFGYVNVFAPRANEDGTAGKYSVQILIPKENDGAIRLVKEAIEGAKTAGAQKKWNGKIPVAAKLHLPLRDGDEEFPDDENYAGMYFLNASSANDRKPGVGVIENGQLNDALDGDDFYSGCYGVAAINFYAYSNSGNNGIAVGLNNVAKTKDGDRLSGGKSMKDDFSDLVNDAASFLD